MVILARFRWKEGVKWGVLENEKLFNVRGDIYDKFEKGEELCRLEQVSLLAPAEPRIMVACALNYIDHIMEMGRIAPREPKLFFKPPNTLMGPLDEVRFPSVARDYRFEAELCVVMKRRTRSVTEADALKHVLGYTCGNDFGALDLLKQDENLTRARGFDTSGPLGPFLVTGLNPQNLSIKGRVNGELKQDSNTSAMIHGVPKLISHISAFMTLMPGDVIWTGTPKGGACPVKVGDTIEVEIEGIGILKNRVAAPE